VLPWGHAVMLSSRRHRCCLPVRRWAAVRRLAKDFRLRGTRAAW
jgi:hypothetical protein